MAAVAAFDYQWHLLPYMMLLLVIGFNADAGFEATDGVAFASAD